MARDGEETRREVGQRYAVGVGGYPGAGKTTVARLLVEELDAVYVNTGDIVREKAREALGRPVDDTTVGEWIDGRIDEHGTELVSEWVVTELAGARRARYAVIDGCRSDPEPTLRDPFDRLFLVAVDTSELVRHRRIGRRGRTEPAEGRDDREAAYGMEELYDPAVHDARIDNDGSHEELREQVGWLADALP